MSGDDELDDWAAQWQNKQMKKPKEGDEGAAPPAGIWWIWWKIREITTAEKRQVRYDLRYSCGLFQWEVGRSTISIRNLLPT